MVNSRVAKSDLDTEMTVVRNEFERDENNADGVLEERVLSTAYLWHSYGRSPIGTLSDIEKVPIEKLQAFYRNYYQPDDAMLLVAGKFDPAKTLGWITELFGAIPKPTRKLLPTYTEEPTQDGEREVVLRRVGDHQSVMMAFHVPAGAHPDSPALDVLSGILSEAPSGRLYKALVESKKAVSADAENYSLHDPGVEMFSATVAKDKSLDDAEKTMLSVIDGLIKEPPNKEEVDRAKTRLLKNIDLELNNSGRVGLVLSEWGSMGDWRLLFLNRDQVEKVTPEDIARVAKQYLKPDNRTIGRYLPADQAGPLGDSAQPGHRGRAQGLQGQGRRRRRRGVRSVAGQYRSARHARHAARRPEAGSVAQENPRRHGGREPAAAFRRREEPGE